MVSDSVRGLHGPASAPVQFGTPRTCSGSIHSVLPRMAVHLVNPSHLSFGVGVITPRWLFVLAGATPTTLGQPRITDETLEPLRSRDGAARRRRRHRHSHRQRAARLRDRHARRGLAARPSSSAASTRRSIPRKRTSSAARTPSSRATATWLAARARRRGARHAAAGLRGGRVEAEQFVSARWDLLPQGRYMWGSVQTVRGCPKHCSFCSVWRTDGQKPRQRRVDAVVGEIRRAPPTRLPLRRAGRRQLLSGDAGRPGDGGATAQHAARLEQLRALRAERFELMDRLAQLPSDMVFFTQITMEAAEDPAFLDAMRRANIKGALVGVEAVTPEGLKDVYKGFNDVGEALVAAAADVPRARRARPRLVHLRTAERSAGDVRRHGRHRRSRRADLCAVRDADAVSRAPSTSPPGRRALAATRPASPASRSRATG